MAYLLDTYILLRLFDRKSPVYRSVEAAVDELRARGEAIHFAPQNAAEFWNVATRPRDKNGYGLSPAEAEQLLREAENLFTLLPDTPLLYSRWRSLVLAVQVSGMQVHDARLVAWMKVHGVTHVLTLNTDDFTRYVESTGITVVHPEDLLGASPQ